MCMYKHSNTSKDLIRGCFILRQELYSIGSRRQSSDQQTRLHILLEVFILELCYFQSLEIADTLEKKEKMLFFKEQYLYFVE